MTSPHANSPRRLILLGATGSIGRQALEVIAHLNRERARDGSSPLFDVVGLAAGRNGAALAQAGRAHPSARLALAETIGNEAPPGCLTGEEAAQELVETVEADVVVGAMVGFAGLPAMLAATKRGCDIALANKEALVAAGELMIGAARAHGAHLLPVDSEHSGLWQALAPTSAAPWSATAPPFQAGPDVRSVTLTASGGALRGWSRDAIYHATPDQALSHPTWDMGAKVTIDTASLTNKALELIEAAWLFGLEAPRLKVLVHPQSIVHALVEFVDRSVVAQLGVPDMRTPIQVALTWPERAAGLAPSLSLAETGRLDFEAPDVELFPAIPAGLEVIRRGGTSGAVFSAANEAAVEAFLEGAIPFGRISELACSAIDAVGTSSLRTIDDVFAADAEGRRYVTTALSAATSSNSAPQSQEQT